MASPKKEARLRTAAKHYAKRGRTNDAAGDAVQIDRIEFIVSPSFDIRTGL